MGYRLETYKLSELNRISSRGSVVPALFWWLPIGRWSEQELWRVWIQFVDDRESICHKVGLALIKEQGLRTGGTAHDISGIAGHLQDLMPEGSMVERPLDEEAHFLLLSGAYPQPGWGLLVSKGPATQDIEALASSVVMELGAECHERTQWIAEAAAAYHDLRATPRPRVDPASIEALRNEIERSTALGAALRDLVEALESGEFAKVGEFRTRHRDSLAELGEVELLQHGLFNAWKLDDQLRQIHDSSQQEEIRKVLLDLHEKRAAGEEIKPKVIALTGMGQVIKPWLQAGEHAPGIDLLFVDPEARFQRRIAQCRVQLSAMLQRLEARLGRAQMELERKRDEAEHTHKVQERQRMDAETRFRRALIKAVEAQTIWGTRFLVEFETVCRRSGIQCVNVAWDPARMVGWKLWARNADMRLEDLYTMARELTPLREHPELQGDPKSLTNGSLFTDYVHYIAYSDLRRTPREVTVALLDKLRVSERRSILEAHHGSGAIPSSPVTAEQLVTALGWPDEGRSGKRPLADVFEEGRSGLRHEVDGNDLRKVLESFCKDVVDVAGSELGLPEDELLGHVNARIPQYRSTHRRWADEVAHLTLGTAPYLMEALLPDAFPNGDGSIAGMVSDLRTLARLLNPESHDQEGPAPRTLDRQEAARCAARLLDATNALLGELPWHFSQLQSTGRQPQVLTGTGWSHSHPEQRSIRLMLWTGEHLEREALVWNRERINPIITDPRIIRRPGRRT